MVVLVLVFSLSACSEENASSEGEVSSDDKKSSEEVKASDDEIKDDEDGETDQTETDDPEGAKEEFPEGGKKENLIVVYNLKKNKDSVEDEYSIIYMKSGDDERFDITSNQKRNYIVYNKADNRTYFWDDDVVGRIEKGRIIDFIYMPPGISINDILGDPDVVIEKNGDTTTYKRTQFIDGEEGIAKVEATFIEDSTFPHSARYTFENMTLDYLFDNEESGKKLKPNLFIKPEFVQFETQEYSSFTLNPDLKGMALINSLPEHSNEILNSTEEIRLFMDGKSLEVLFYNLYAKDGRFKMSILNPESTEVKDKISCARESDEFRWLNSKGEKSSAEFEKEGKREALFRFLTEDIIYEDMSQDLKRRGPTSLIKLVNAELVNFQGKEVIFVERTFKDKTLGNISEQVWYSVKNKYPIKRIIQQNGVSIIETETIDVKLDAEYNIEDFNLN